MTDVKDIRDEVLDEARDLLRNNPILRDLIRDAAIAREIRDTCTFLLGEGNEMRYNGTDIGTGTRAWYLIEWILDQWRD